MRRFSEHRHSVGVQRPVIIVAIVAIRESGEAAYWTFTEHLF